MIINSPFTVIVDKKAITKTHDKACGLALHCGVWLAHHIVQNGTRFYRVCLPTIHEIKKRKDRSRNGYEMGEHELELV